MDTKLSAKTQIKLAREAFEALLPLNHQDWTPHANRLYDLCRSEEKDHRGFLPDFNAHHSPNAASISDCAKLFAVRRVAEYMNGQEMPKGKDFLHYHKSAFYAAGLVDEYRAIIAKEWAAFDLETLANLNYTDVVKVREVAIAA